MSSEQETQPPKKTASGVMFTLMERAQKGELGPDGKALADECVYHFHRLIDKLFLRQESDDVEFLKTKAAILSIQLEAMRLSIEVMEKVPQPQAETAEQS